MKINFNNVRKQAVFAYGKLAKELNEAIDCNGDIAISVHNIQECMDDLRSTIASIAFTFIPGDDDFKDLFDEVGDIPIFNPQTEDE